MSDTVTLVQRSGARHCKLNPKREHERASEGVSEEKEKRKRKNGEIRIPNGLFTCLCVLSVFYYVKRFAYLVLVSDYGLPPHISSYLFFFDSEARLLLGNWG